MLYNQALASLADQWNARLRAAGRSDAAVVYHDFLTGLFATFALFVWSTFFSILIGDGCVRCCMCTRSFLMSASSCIPSQAPRSVPNSIETTCPSSTAFIRPLKRIKHWRLGCGTPLCATALVEPIKRCVVPLRKSTALQYFARVPVPLSSFPDDVAWQLWLVARPR